VFSMQTAIFYKVKNTLLEFSDGVEKGRAPPSTRSLSLDLCRGSTGQVAIEIEKRFSEPMLSSTKNTRGAVSFGEFRGTDRSQIIKATWQDCSQDQQNASKVQQSQSRAFGDVIDSNLADGKLMRNFSHPLDVKPTNGRTRKKRAGAALRNEFGGAKQPPPQTSDVDPNTVMIRNIACRYSHEEVSEVLDEVGLKGKYNFLYVPLNAKHCANLGYCFVNFVEEHHVGECMLLFSGKVFGKRLSEKRCEVSPAHMQFNFVPHSVSTVAMLA